jgi:hypothetical protein
VAASGQMTATVQKYHTARRNRVEATFSTRPVVGRQSHVLELGVGSEAPGTEKGEGAGDASAVPGST